MAMQFRRNAGEESSDESDEDYIPPERVEVEDDDGESGEADLEPSSGGDTDLDVGKRKRKRRMRVKAKGGKKKAKVDNSSDNNDETTSNETLVYLPLKAASYAALPSSATDNSSSTPSPCPASSAQSSSHDLSIPSSLDLPSQFAVRDDGESLQTSTASSSSTSQVPPVSTPTPPASQSGLSSMLAKLSGKKKQSALEKSQLEWNKYKSTNALEEELTQHNKALEDDLSQMYEFRFADEGSGLREVRCGVFEDVFWSFRMDERVCRPKFGSEGMSKRTAAPEDYYMRPFVLPEGARSP